MQKGSPSKKKPTRWEFFVNTTIGGKVFYNSYDGNDRKAMLNACLRSIVRSQETKPEPLNNNLRPR